MNDAGAFQTERERNNVFSFLSFSSFWKWRCKSSRWSIVPNPPIGTLPGRYEKKKKAHQNKTKLSCAIYYGKLDWPTSELDREGGEREKKKERISRPKHHKEVSFYQKQATDAAAHAREIKLYVLFVAVGKRAKQS